jgi:hypothetical protein
VGGWVEEVQLPTHRRHRYPFRSLLLRNSELEQLEFIHLHLQTWTYSGVRLG